MRDAYCKVLWALSLVETILLIGLRFEKFYWFIVNPLVSHFKITISTYEYFHTKRTDF